MPGLFLCGRGVSFSERGGGGCSKIIIRKSNTQREAAGHSRLKEDLWLPDGRSLPAALASLHACLRLLAISRAAGGALCNIRALQTHGPLFSLSRVPGKEETFLRIYFIFLTGRVFFLVFCFVFSVRPSPSTSRFFLAPSVHFPLPFFTSLSLLPSFLLFNFDFFFSFVFPFAVSCCGLKMELGRGPSGGRLWYHHSKRRNEKWRRKISRKRVSRPALSS